MKSRQRLPESFRTQPIMKYKPMLALKSHKLEEDRPGPRSDQPSPQCVKHGSSKETKYIARSILNL